MNYLPSIEIGLLYVTQLGRPRKIRRKDPQEFQNKVTQDFSELECLCLVGNVDNMSTAKAFG